MCRFQKCLVAVAALFAVSMLAPASASARGPVRYVMSRPALRAPVYAVRTVRVVTPPYAGYYYAPRHYVPARVYIAPISGPVIYVD